METKKYNMKDWYIVSRTWEYMFLIQDVLDRIDDLDNVDIWQEIDTTIIYTKDQWTIIKEWFCPNDDDISLSEALNYFYDDVEEALSQVIKNNKEQENE